MALKSFANRRAALASLAFALQLGAGRTAAAHEHHATSPAPTTCGDCQSHEHGSGHDGSDHDGGGEGLLPDVLAFYDLGADESPLPDAYEFAAILSLSPELEEEQVSALPEWERAGWLLPVTASEPSVVGHWDRELIEGEVTAVHLSLLPNGKIVYWSGFAAGESDTLEPTFFVHEVHAAESRVLDLEADPPTVTNPPPSETSDMVCIGQSIMPDGRLIAVGGSDWSTIPEDGTGWNYVEGTKETRFFDYRTMNWTRGADMNHGRWYPTTVVMPDGEVVVVSGLNSLTKSVQTAVERFDPASERWREAANPWSLPPFPRVALVPAGPLKGKLFYTPNGSWPVQDPAEGYWALQQTWDPATETVRFYEPLLFGTRNLGATVMLPLDALDGYRTKLLTFGGALARVGVVGTNLAEITDLGTDPPKGRVAAPLHHPRFYPMGVALPDGAVLAVGGVAYDNTGPSTWGQPERYVMEAELYDPEADTWSVLPKMQVPRGYHATAILLPDGRVLVGGHVPNPFPVGLVRDNVPPEDQIVETRFEIFEPPYLFRGPRPEIVAAPARADYGKTFRVLVDRAEDVRSVSLVRLPTTTHAMDSDQRMLRLAFVRHDDGLTVLAPPDAAIAPSGTYMLFVNASPTDGSQGLVPSVARFVTL